MVLNNVTKFHKTLIKSIRLRERTSFKTMNFHKQRAITAENIMQYGWLVGLIALCPKSTAMVIAGRSVHLTTLFPGQA